MLKSRFNKPLDTINLSHFYYMSNLIFWKKYSLDEEKNVDVEKREKMKEPKLGSSTNMLFSCLLAE
jgi:hypothetical protein